MELEIKVIDNKRMGTGQTSAIAISKNKMVFYQPALERTNMVLGDSIILGNSGPHFFIARRPEGRVGFVLRKQNKNTVNPSSLMINSNSFLEVPNGHYNLGQRMSPDTNGTEWWPLIRI